MVVDLQDFFSVAGTISCVSLTLSPSVPIFQVLKGKEKIDIIPEGTICFLLLARLVWASVWIITGRKIALLNCTIGVTASNIFITLYCYLYFNRSCIKTFFSFILLLSLEGGFLYASILWGNYIILSYIAMTCKIIMSISPAQKIMRVIREKNYKLIPIYSAMTNIFCSFFWFCYGICINLYGQIISNLIGLSFSVANSLIWLCYYLKRDKKEEEKEKSEEKDDKDTELVEK